MLTYNDLNDGDKIMFLKKTITYWRDLLELESRKQRFGPTASDVDTVINHPVTPDNFNL